MLKHRSTIEQSKKDDPDEYDIVDYEKLTKICQEEASHNATTSGVAGTTEATQGTIPPGSSMGEESKTAKPPGASQQSETDHPGLSEQSRKLALAYYGQLPKEILDIYQRYWEYNFATK